MHASDGKIFIVSTPIGNLGDITERARLALGSCDAIYAEDTRVTGKLVKALEIDKPLVRLDEQMMAKRAKEAVRRAASGEIICYCSDAGMPGVSDPGSRLVALAREEQVPLEVLPGPSAVTLAYVSSATQDAHFYFGGFFPRKEAEAAKLLCELRGLDAALIFYESPKRLLASLAVIADQLPHREVSVCRELTKLHEETLRAKARELLEAFASRAEDQPIKGEIVIVIDGPSPEEHEEDARFAIEGAASMARELQESGMRAKDIARKLSDTFGIPRNKAYEIAIDIR